MFRTLPDNLVEHAEAALKHFEQYGYTVKAERDEVGFPQTPTLLCRRKRTTLILEVVSKIDFARLKEWVAYGRSYGGDFRAAVCVPEVVGVKADDEEALRNLGVGLYVVASEKLKERLQSSDLALNVELPQLGRLQKKIRKALGPAYEEFDKRQWLDGFETACKALEEEGRRYLKRHVARKRIQVIDQKGKVTTPSPKQVNKMPLGTLAKQFSQIASKTRADSILEKAFTAVNKDRVAVTHFRSHRRTEDRLRRNVGRHMWTIVSAMKVAFD